MTADINIGGLDSLTDNDTIHYAPNNTVSTHSATYLVIDWESHTVRVVPLEVGRGEVLMAERDGEITTYMICSTTADEVRALLRSDTVQALIARELAHPEEQESYYTPLADALCPPQGYDAIRRVENNDDFDAYCADGPAEWVEYLGITDWDQMISVLRAFYRPVDVSEDMVWLDGDEPDIANVYDIANYLDTKKVDIAGTTNDVALIEMLIRDPDLAVRRALADNTACPAHLAALAKVSL